VGQWSRALGDRKLVYLGLATLAIGLIATALTPAQPVVWYSQAQLTAELTVRGASLSPIQIPIELPSDTNIGWVGLIWILIAMIPASIGGGILHPAINSLITKRIEPHEIGGMLGISSAFLSGANAIAPVIGGAIFQALGSTAPFLIGGIVLGILLFFSIPMIKPGREEIAGAGLARGGAAH
jgi:MFS family permease